MLVAEKSGLLKIFPNLTTNTFTIVADLRNEVYNNWDRGLLGMAIDPNFATNNYVYVLYSTTPSSAAAAEMGPRRRNIRPCPTPPGGNTDGCVISGRLSRLTATGSDWTASEHPLSMTGASSSRATRSAR